MKLIVGLGNPGEEYKYTRHNVGFLIIDRICEKLNVKLNKEKFNGVFVKVDDIVIAKPMTYMNLSGTFVQQLKNFFKIDSTDIMIIHDDKDYDLSKATIKIGGSGGSHNGVKSIIDNLGTSDFKRMKIGINAPHQGQLKDFVLGKFSSSEMEKILPIIDLAAETAISFGFNDIYTIMNKFNVNKK
ncbi:aminoacyl-tRNA hydrolase [Mycoplasma sp. CSL10137]|uniref:aminoacyl-tRNA hydrolase n=1 Tax=unclassified Mycoplasma TaxID=2683645 RepID=UPI00197C90D0|nr:MULTISPECIES: aminoacyl-tRNA hydrolase [unclassified Mycoplasma]MBN4083648.1 aminoacyl-tRNA hydrolase [Mycoplasma sp. CSL10137]MBN4084067.1 aminoacyl-tRNA hydrolase [Mycoplasma sp. CSL10166]MBU4693266.1 aminoacyl-tRNA hydrolase [Mycoplasma sp. CSL7491-lung]